MRYLIVVTLMALAPTAAVSHSGGTNKDGCHRNSKTGDYHCHNPKR